MSLEDIMNTILRGKKEESMQEPRGEKEQILTNDSSQVMTKARLILKVRADPIIDSIESKHSRVEVI